MKAPESPSPGGRHDRGGGGGGGRRDAAGRGAAGGERHGQSSGLRRDRGGPRGLVVTGGGDQYRQARGRRRDPHPTRFSKTTSAESSSSASTRGRGSRTSPRAEWMAYSSSGTARAPVSGHRADGRRARDLLLSPDGERPCSRASGRADPPRLSGLAMEVAASAWPSPARAHAVTAGR